MNSIETKEAELKELEAKSAELATQIEQKRKELEQEKHDGPFVMPADGVAAWVAKIEVSRSSKWSDASRFYAHELESGLISKKISDIESIIQMERQWGQFRLKAIQIADGWVPDHYDLEIRNWFVEYEVVSGKFTCNYSQGYILPNTIYFQTKERAQRLANWANKYVRVK